MHGLSNGLPMLKSLCKDYDIVLIQEHWLISDDLVRLDVIDENFTSFKVSSMDKKISSGILTGRPHRGVSIVFKKSLCKLIQVIETDTDNGQFITIKFLSSVKNVFMTCVYFPCAGSFTEYSVSTSYLLPHIENVLESNPGCVHLIAGGLNFECNGSSVGYDIFKDYELISYKL